MKQTPLIVISICLLAAADGAAQSRKIPLPKKKPPLSEATKPTLADKVANHYVVLAHERYLDSRVAAKELNGALREFVGKPSEQTHAAAKQAWIKAHTVYSHTEVFRFGNPNVDEWETKVNAWPMDEGFLDYVAPGYVADEGNPHALQNLIGSPSFQIDDGYIVEARSGMDPKAGPKSSVANLETNVATGYHVIEFLLWGQDLNRDPGDCGRRPFTDYLTGEGNTHGHGKRRGDYLTTVASILDRDLFYIIQDWDPNRPTLYSKLFTSLPVEERLRRMLLGMGSLCNGELAGERIMVALLASDQEEEQNCFSDTTHLAIYHNALSIQSTYLGRHRRGDGSEITGPSVADLVAKVDRDLDRQIRQEMKATMAAAGEVVERAENGEPFDQMIQFENAEGRALLQKLIGRLKRQTLSIEKINGMIPELAKL